ncbi:hypothetical protein PARPLA_00947 [Rhodobacteraceae bacterium THAF1]|nr:hypothetical protein FIU81_02210 [Palleronia sp. THAF1]VDC20424.1 hypothetical protein PARPLA_00947 [Rhodobacteraceae bacterium THAF1]
MFTTPTVRQAPADTDGVYAFHIVGEVTSDDMETMAEYMNTQFDTHDKVSMLLIFDRYDGAESGASLDWDVIKSRVRSVAKVDKYAVVGAPEKAGDMVETMSKVLPVDGRAFDTEAEGWAFVGAKPKEEELRT